MNTHEPIIDFSKIKATCTTCNLHELCLPRGLSVEDLNKLDYVIKGSRPIQKNKHIFRSNDSFHSFFAVRSGSVKAYTLNESGEEQIIGFYFPGEILGFDAIEEHKHTCSAVALETTTVCSIPYTKLNEISAQVPELQDQILRLISREITKENKLLLTINKRSAEERIATFLVSLSSRFQKLGYSAKEFNLPMSRQDIGNYLGLTIETVSRLFTKFQKNGLIKIDKKSISIQDLSTLRTICEGFSDKSNNSVA
ncbi:MAG: fumarate/nitrate reduction transcriptional regulator Fnr [Proteobacteria bacterium]|nr:fumarate/nitrate reduction transcriptional regulator Fnr [Pseudomonadota bacterium]NOG61584.1 fumarate/nitrate reduction transcriptional regulator Fnr [Pseudomonadota bacterium]